LIRGRAARNVSTLLLALPLMMTACTGLGQALHMGPPTQPTLVIAASIGDADTLDPAEADQPTSIATAHELYSNLVTYANGDTTAVVPQVASSWTMSQDGLTWTFYLRRGLRFADGDPLTASDVVYSFARLVSLPGDSAASLMSQTGITAGNVAGQVVALDSTTVQIKLVQPMAPGAFLAILAYPATGIVDERMVRRHTVGGDWGHRWLDDHSAGGGPYALLNWDRGRQIVLVANPEWTLGPRPQLARVVERDVPDGSAELHQLEHGGADVALNLTPQLLQQARRTRGIAVVSVPELSLEYLGMDVRNVPAQGEVLVRRAVKYAIDYKGIVQDLLGGQAVLNESVVPEGVYGYDSSLPYTQDLAEARQLLAEAGYRNGFRATMLVPTGTVLGGVSGLALASALRTDLGQAGIAVTLQVEPPATIAVAYADQQTQMVLGQWSAAYPDPDWFAQAFGDYGAQGLAWREQWNDPQLSQLVELAGSMANGAQRTSLYQQIDQYEMENGPFAVLYQPLRSVAVSARLGGIHLNPIWGLELQDVTRR
jgi:peptide/nickel transport system substrate-binding protein